MSLGVKSKYLFGRGSSLLNFEGEQLLQSLSRLGVPVMPLFFLKLSLELISLQLREWFLDF